jgi:hypothetical protein
VVAHPVPDEEGTRIVACGEHGSGRDAGQRTDIRAHIRLPVRHIIIAPRALREERRTTDGSE